MSFTFLGIASGANAQNLSVQNNQVNITATGFAGAMPTIATDGIVQQVTGVPDQGDGLNVVNFGFTLEQASVPDGSYNFAFGVMLDDDNSLRRLEVKLPTVTMSFSGGTLTGSVAGSQTINALGRNDDGSVQAVATFTDNGSGLTFNGSSLSVNMNSILNLIQASTGNFNNIINSLNEEGHYTYTVALKETTSGGLKFGTGATGTFNQFGCMVGTNIFMLNGNQLATDFDKAFGLQGQLSFSGAGGAAGSAPTAFATSNCLTSSGGGSGGSGGGSTTTPTTPPATSIDQLSTADLTTPSAETIALVGAAVTNVQTATQSIADGLAAGTATVTAGLDALNSLSTTLTTSGTLATAGGNPQPTSALTGAISSASNVVGNLSAATPDQLTQLDSTLTALTTSVTANIAPTLTTTDASSISKSVGDLLQNFTKAGGSPSAALLSASQSTANQLLTASSTAIVSLTPSIPVNLSINDILSKVPVPTVSSRDRISIIFQSFRRNAPRIRIRSSLINLSDNVLRFFNVGTQNAQLLNRALVSTNPLGNRIAAAIGSGVALAVDDASNLTEVTSAGEQIATEFLSINVVPAALAEGVEVLPDGTALVVDNDLGFLAAPTARNLALFTSALSSDYNATVTQNAENGSFILENAGVKASVTFVFEGYGASAAAAIGPVTLSAPAGTNPADPNYRYSVNYGDGIAQALLPYPAETNFLDHFLAAGTPAVIDRATGVIDLGNGTKMKPDFFVTPYSDSLAVFISNNDTNGDGIVLVSIPDVNGDGLSDYQMVSSVGSQVFYSVP